MKNKKANKLSKTQLRKLTDRQSHCKSRAGNCHRFGSVGAGGFSTVERSRFERHRANSMSNSGDRDNLADQSRMVQAGHRNPNRNRLSFKMSKSFARKCQILQTNSRDATVCGSGHRCGEVLWKKGELGGAPPD